MNNIVFALILQFAFTKPLVDLHVTENEFAVFECEVNKKNIPVDWFINEVKIEPTSKHQILMEGTTHRFSINMTKPEDAGEVKAVFRKAVSTAKLTVEREFCFVVLA
jgi:hypothetical protein